VLVQVKNKRKRSMPVGLQVWSRQVGFVRGTRWPAGPSTAWWKEQQDEVVYGFFVEPQNQGRAGMNVGAGPVARGALCTLP
jgi:hypothetical protein